MKSAKSSPLAIASRVAAMATAKRRVAASTSRASATSSTLAKSAKFAILAPLPAITASMGLSASMTSSTRPSVFVKWALRAPSARRKLNDFSKRRKTTLLKFNKV